MSFETLLNKIKTNITPTHEPSFTSDWFSAHINRWTDWLKGLKDKPALRCLEIGCFEGRSTIWLLENILTHPTSRLYVIDPFNPNKPEMPMVRERFLSNIEPYQTKVRLFETMSQDTLRNDASFVCPNFFDFIYIDGSHQACHVLEDAVLSFRLLKNNGILIFDDYELVVSKKHPKRNPKVAIDAFLDCFEEQYQLIHKGWQVCLVKKIKSPDSPPIAS